MRKLCRLVFFLSALSLGLAAAQDNSALTVLWPSPEQASLKFTFGKFQQSGMVNGQGIFLSDVTAQNVSDQGIPKSMLTIFVSDKNGVRIGSARLQLSEIGPYRTRKAQLQFSAAGTPACVTLLVGKAIPLRVLSVPAGANFKVDGEDAGMTPKMVDFTIGVHTLEFSKEGYAPGRLRSKSAPTNCRAAASVSNWAVCRKIHSNCATERPCWEM